MEHTIDVIVLFLLIAVAVAVATRRIKIPYTVALVVVGLLLAFARWLGTGRVELLEGLSIELSPKLILLLFLPPLLFEGALAMDLGVLRRNAPRVLLLALPGTFCSFALLGLVTHEVLGFPVLWALMMAAIVAATDPVSVLALFKDQGVNHDLSFTVEGESISNDGIAVVLFVLLSELIAEHGTDTADLHAQAAVFEGARLFLFEVGVAIVIGIGLGFVTHRILGTMDAPLTEVAISIVLAFGVYILADLAHASGVVAVAAAGLIIGNFGKVLSMSPSTRLTLTTFWEVIAFLMNSLLFLLMGANVDLPSLGANFGYAAALFGIAVAVRAAVVYFFMTALYPTRWRVPFRWIHVINWGGVRGSIPIALVLGLPAVPAAGVVLANGTALLREDLVAIVFGVVLFSLFAQGLTIGPLVQWLGLAGRDDARERFERLQAREAALRAAEGALDRLLRQGETTAEIRDRLHAELRADLSGVGATIRGLLAAHPELLRAERLQARRAILLAARAALEDARRRGLISNEALEHEIHDIDGRIALLEERTEADGHGDDAAQQEALVTRLDAMVPAIGIGIGGDDGAGGAPVSQQAPTEPSEAVRPERPVSHEAPTEIASAIDAGLPDDPPAAPEEPAEPDEEQEKQIPPTPVEQVAEEFPSGFSDRPSA